MAYLWVRPEWPAFNWNNSAVLEPLVQARFGQGRLLALAPSFVHSFEILDNHASLYEDLLSPAPESAAILSWERIAGWQASLFPTGYAGVRRIRAGLLRTRGISADTLPAEKLPSEIDKFLIWWHEVPAALDPVLRSGLAFFWFYLLSPFEAGNFEIACALSESALQENEKTPVRTYDISVQLRENRSRVLHLIQEAAGGRGDLTDWLVYYLQLYLSAVQASLVIADQDRTAEKFWARHAGLKLNTRQRQVLNVLLQESPGDGGEITNRRYVLLCGSTRESAKRDLADLVRQGLLRPAAHRGRSARYLFRPDPQQP